MSKYDDIINLKRPLSRRKPMSIENRAAQFAPFSALTGYSEAVKETARITDNKMVLCDGVKEIINEKINYIIRNFKNVGEVSITYFVKDKKKVGGRYVTITDFIKKIDVNNARIYMNNGSIVFMDDISNIAGELFNNFDM